jgi:hypothetical protein
MVVDRMREDPPMNRSSGRSRTCVTIAVTVVIAGTLTGCASTVGGQPLAGATPAASSASETRTTRTSTSPPAAESSATTDRTTTSLGTRTTQLSATTPATTPSSTTVSESSTTDTASTAVTSSTAVLDRATATWFETFCAGIADATQYAVPDTSGQSVAELQATVVAAYSSIAVSASGTAAALSVLMPPPIEGGQQLHEAGVARFASLADIYGQGASTVAALQPTSAADVERAVETVEQQASAGAAGTMATVPQRVLEAARELPACVGVLNA